MDGVPIFDIVFDESSEVKAISLVNNPAIQSDYMMFSDSHINFELADQDERMLLGAALIPDRLILRKDPMGNPFFIRFSRDVIKRTAYNYFRDHKNTSINADHNPDWFLNGVYVVGGFIKDSKIGMNPPERFSELPDGTWFVFAKVDDDEIWSNYIKTGEFKGFSIEGHYGMSDTGTTATVTMSEDAELQDVFNSLLCELERVLGIKLDTIKD